MLDTQVWDPIAQKERPAWIVEAVDRLLDKVRHQDIWQITDFIIAIWARKHPEEHKAFLKSNSIYKDSRANRYASTKDKSRRELANVPNEVMYLLDKIASHKIEEYGRQKFWRSFARRYPGFAIAEKI